MFSIDIFLRFSYLDSYQTRWTEEHGHFNMRASLKLMTRMVQGQATERFALD